MSNPSTHRRKLFTESDQAMIGFTYKDKLKLLIETNILCVLILSASLIITLEDTVAVAETNPPAKAKETTPLAFETSDFDRWAKEVAELPAEEQVTAVSESLMELNPGFDGEMTHKKIHKGIVTELRFNTEKVTDISPVRVLSGLKSLEIYGERVVGTLADLSPPEGMRLTTLYCYKSQVADLSPLKGMPLVNFNCTVTRVTDLSPLNGMPLVALTCSNNPQISDISVLKGMRLTTLAVHNTKVPDLSLLKELPLKFVDCDIKSEQDAEILRSIKTLETINGKPVAEFWKEFDEQPKGKKPGQ